LVGMQSSVKAPPIKWVRLRQSGIILACSCIHYLSSPGKPSTSNQLLTSSALHVSSLYSFARGRHLSTIHQQAKPTRLTCRIARTIRRHRDDLTFLYTIQKQHQAFICVCYSATCVCSIFPTCLIAASLFCFFNPLSCPAIFQGFPQQVP